MRSFYKITSNGKGVIGTGLYSISWKQTQTRIAGKNLWQVRNVKYVYFKYSRRYSTLQSLWTLPIVSERTQRFYNWICFRLHAKHDRNRSSFRNAMSFRILDDGQNQELSNPKSNIPSSESFRIDLNWSILSYCVDNKEMHVSAKRQLYKCGIKVTCSGINLCHHQALSFWMSMGSSHLHDDYH
jgi:hypothetical protein